jgi:hypothetical protein
LFRNVAVTNPYATRAAFKISQNESPLPQTRVFLGFDYLDSVRGAGGSFAGSQSTSSSSVTSTSTQVGTGFTDSITTRVDTSTTTSTTGGFSPRRLINAYHDIIGFEYAFLDSRASIGVRAPVVHQTGDASLGLDDFGDVSVIFKGLLYNDPDSGVAISGGLMITAPTGPDINTIHGNINSTLLQPYTGLLWNSGGFFVQGFSSIIVPTNEHDVTLWLNSIGAGFTFYRSQDGGLLRSLTPVAEVHVTTPMNNHGPQDAIDVPDVVNITSGFEVGVGDRGLFTLGVTVPVSSERTFDVGVLAAFNMRF